MATSGNSRKRTGVIHIGTSGWHYKHWIGTFYPVNTKPKDQFEHYKKTFSTVELNNPFYRLPSLETFEGWKKSAPRGFLFSVKASRYITHMKKLHDTEKALQLFLKNARGLGKKLGPILFQLPPGWKVNLERFEAFLHTLPRRHRYVFEFRNATWYTDEMYGLLRKYNCAFCQYELSGHHSPAVVTANFVYVRLHGPGNKYQGSYNDKALEQWKHQIIEWSNEKRDVFIYFDNDQAGYAAFNAAKLQDMISGS